ncbi:hypothetical protein MMPV_006312 [Pyropia vietnamensis]
MEPPFRPAPVRVGGAGGATYTVTPAPLALAIDAVVDPPLDPSVRGDGGVAPPKPEPLPADEGPLAPTATQREERSFLLSDVAGLAAQQLVEWADWSATLPQSDFVGAPECGDGGGGGGGGSARWAAAPPLAALAPAPDGSELFNLVRGPDGKQRRLTSEQLTSIRQLGTFAIPSERYRGANYTFRLPDWVVRGAEPVAATLWERTGRALDHVTVSLKRRLRGRRSSDGEQDIDDGSRRTRRCVGALSVATAGRQAIKGIVGVADLLVGLPHSQPRCADEHALAARATAEEAAYVAAAAEADAAAAVAAGRPPRDTRFVRTVAAVRAEAAGVRSPTHAEGVSITDADAIAVLDDLLSGVTGAPPPTTTTPDGDALSPAEAACADERKAVVNRVMKLPSLVRAGLTDAARRRLTAAHVTADAMARVAPAMAARQASVEAAVCSEHPRRAAGPRWRASEVARRLRAEASVSVTATAPPFGTFVRPGPWEEAPITEGANASFILTYAADPMLVAARDAVVEALAAAGDELADEAADERARVTFWREHWPAMEAAAVHRRVAARTVTRRWVRWNARTWKRTTANGQTAVDPFARRTVRSGHVGWRLSVAAVTAGSIANNGAYLAATTAASGRFGVRALLTRAPFVMNPPEAEGEAATAADDHVMDGGSIGRFVVRRRVRKTAASRLSARWMSVQAERQAFEAAPDVGLVPKAAVRWIHYVTNYAVRGVLGSAVLCLGLPVATVATLVACTLGAVATPMVAVAAAAIEYVGCAVLVDAHAPDTVAVVGAEPSSLAAEVRPPARRYRRAGRRALHVLPLPRRVAQVLVMGGGQAVAATAAAGAYHPVAAAVTVAAAAVAAASRNAVDAVATAALRRVGRQPGADSWLAARVGGPGVSAAYYYRLDDAVIARAVRGRLEELELAVVDDALAAVIAAPANAWAAYVAHTGAIGSGVDGDTSGLCALAAASSTGRRLDKAAGPRAAALAADVAARRAVLRRATAPHLEKGRLRPAGEPAAAAAAVESAVGAFVRERLAPLGDGPAAAVAAAAGVPPGDDGALARAIVRDVFGPDFFTPLAVSDKTLQIPVSFPPLLSCP